ncbi:MAG TPA: VOC family protein [Chitinophagaceae bacterium]|jgi:catechol 2,3-dioxygenase-like lactoylglutathione lyase family enzyme|nr:VOC family protein [Chitinophagaceae bacterium]
MKRICLFILCLIPVLAFTQTAEPIKKKSMKDTTHHAAVAEQLLEVYTVFISKDIKQSRDFYQDYFGFTPIFESSWFILLQSPGKKGFYIAFMSEEHPSSPPSPKAMKGDGAFLTLQVADAKKVHDAMKAANLKVDYPLTVEDWGQRRFAINDPNGIHIDVVEQVEAKAGYWEKYMLKQ